MKKAIIALLVVSVAFLIGCNDEYENHALAFLNSTNDTIQVDRHYSSSINPRTVYIAADEYEKFYETSADLWVSPQVELEKICDSIVIIGKDFRICFNADFTDNYCQSPYSAMADWELEVIVNETPKFLGKQLERFNIHIFEISPACITYNE